MGIELNISFAFGGPISESLFKTWLELGCGPISKALMHVDLKHTLILINKIKEYFASFFFLIKYFAFFFFLEEKEYFA